MDPPLDSRGAPCPAERYIGPAMSYMIAVRRVSHIVAALLALHGAHVPTHAQRTDSASAPEIEVYLVTYGPGRLYWERFGHNAIWIRDPARHIDHMFNYGIFDFNQESFLLRFIQGRMLYTLATQDPQRQFQVTTSTTVPRGCATP